VPSKSGAKWRESLRGLQSAKVWEGTGTLPEPRTCPECQRTLPNTGGYFPGWMSVPAWWSGGDIPCFDCFPAVLARRLGLGLGVGMMVASTVEPAGQ
jgi:hypothetical protein